MKTYWLLGEDQSRHRQRVQRGIARIERTGSTRRRARHLEVKPATPNFSFGRGEGGGGSSQQITPQGLVSGGGSVLGDSNHTMSQSLSGSPYNSIMNCGVDVQSPGRGSIKFQMHPPRSYSGIKYPSSNLLHPYSLLVGPTSQELMRRSSSRRRRLKFTMGGADEAGERKENDSLSGCDDGLDALEFTADALPTIVRGKDGPDDEAASLKDTLDEEDEKPSGNDSLSNMTEDNCNFPSGFSHKTNAFIRNGNAHHLSLDSLEQSVRNDATTVFENSQKNTPAPTDFSSDPAKPTRRIKAPIVRIESFDCDINVSPRFLREGRDIEQRSFSADDASSDILSSIHCDSQQSPIVFVKQRHPPETALACVSNNYQTKQGDGDGDVRANKTGSSASEISNAPSSKRSFNAASFIKSGKTEKNSLATGTNAFNKMLSSSNDLVLQPIATNRVSPMADPLDPFCVDFLDRKDKLPQSKHLDSFENNAQISIMQRKGNNHNQQQLTNETDGIVSLEMIPLLANPEVVADCGVLKQECDDDLV